MQFVSGAFAVRKKSIKEWFTGWAAMAGGAALLAVSMAGQAGKAQAAETLDSLYQAAKSDGVISILGAPNVKLRRAIAESFGARFPDVRVEYFGAVGNAIAAKLRSEQRGDVFNADIIITGVTSGVRLLKKRKLIKPFDDLLLLDDVRDPKNWRDGRLPWVDDDKSMFAFSIAALPALVVNTDLVPEGALKSDMDFLDPRWKGKIVTNNPFRPGAADSFFRRLYESHGKEYLEKLKAQDVAVVDSIRQLVDWVAKGRYAIGLGPNVSMTNLLLDKGVKTLRLEENLTWPDPLILSPGFGILMVAAKTPHPNATKLFANWLLTADGQLAANTALGYSSRRTDVEIEGLPKFMLPFPGRHYQDSASEAYVNHPAKAETYKVLREIGFGR